MFKFLLGLIFLVYSIDGQSDNKVDYLKLYIKSLEVNTAFRNGISLQGGDISIINWVLLYADIASFDAIVPYHPTATAMLAHVQKRLQNYFIFYEHQYWMCSEPCI